MIYERKAGLVTGRAGHIPDTCVSWREPRRSKVPEGLFGDSLKKMTAVTVRHSEHFSIDFPNNQVCLSHLLRNLEYLNDIDKNQAWAGEVQTLLREAIHLRNENPAIPSDNNASERGIRKLKVKQKISGCIRSDTFHALHSIVDPAWKNGQSPLDAILVLV